MAKTAPITQQCNRLQELLSDLKDDAKRKQDAAALNIRRKELQPLQQQLGAAVHRVLLFEEEKLLRRSSRLDLSSAGDLLEKVKALFEDDPMGITKGKTYNRMLKILNEATKQLRQQAGEAWDDETQRLCPSFNQQDIELTIEKIREAL